MPKANLARFADHAGFRYDLLARESGNGHWIENLPADFDGRIEAVRITEYGRLGNVFYQPLHAASLPRLLASSFVCVCSNAASLSASLRSAAWR